MSAKITISIIVSAEHSNLCCFFAFVIASATMVLAWLTLKERKKSEDRQFAHYSDFQTKHEVAKKTNKKKHWSMQLTINVPTVDGRTKKGTERTMKQLLMHIIYMLSKSMTLA